MEFKQFLVENEQAEVRKSLKKIPKRHRALMRGYKYKFEGGCTLKGDAGHIGFIDEKNKTVTIAAPWNYGREYTLLHEIGHAVWKYLVDERLRSRWQKIVDSTKQKQNQGYEELFAMAYASCYAKNKIEIHTHKRWENFIRSLPS